MSKVKQTPLMKAGDMAFWDEFDRSEDDERYVVVDTTSQTILVNNARLTKNKKKIKV